LEKANIRLRNLKRTNDELEEELSQMKQRYRRAQREKDEIEETSSTFPRLR
jgi:chromosome segregation ATPase